MSSLFIVDAQNDFMPGGKLAVADGDKIVPYINELIKAKKWDKIYLSKDWHPQDHKSFAVNVGVEPFTVKDEEMKWPDHCVQGTVGAEINSGLVIPADMAEKVVMVYKGEDKEKEEYSAGKIRKIKDEEIVVVGLATDYCVKATAIDLAKKGAMVVVDLKGCRGVAPESTVKAVEEMKAKGVKIIE